MLLDLALFGLLAVLTNTAFPAPFDPVLLCFAARYSSPLAYVFALLGSVCAGIAGRIDIRVLGRVGERIPARWARLLPTFSGRWFYPAVMLAALLPGTFGVMRVTLVRRRPDPNWYALAVATGRLPRYLLTIHFWQVLAPPAWVPALLFAITMAVALAVGSHRPGGPPLTTMALSRARSP